MTDKPATKTAKKPRKVAYPRLVDAIETFCEGATIDPSVATVNDLVQALSDAFMNEARS